MDTKTLGEVLDSLVDLINDFNDLRYEENKHGRGNDCLQLEIWDDGSGSLKISDNLLEFSYIEQLEEYLSDRLGLKK